MFFLEVYCNISLNISISYVTTNYYHVKFELGFDFLTKEIQNCECYDIYLCLPTLPGLKRNVWFKYKSKQNRKDRKLSTVRKMACNLGWQWRFMWKSPGLRPLPEFGGTNARRDGRRDCSNLSKFGHRLQKLSGYFGSFGQFEAAQQQTGRRNGRCHFGKLVSRHR